MQGTDVVNNLWYVLYQVQQLSKHSSHPAAVIHATSDLIVKNKQRCPQIMGVITACLMRYSVYS